MRRNLTLKEVSILIEKIQKINKTKPSIKHVLFQGEARRYLPALKEIGPYIPLACQILKYIQDNPFANIDDSQFELAQQEISALEAKKKNKDTQNIGESPEDEYPAVGHKNSKMRKRGSNLEFPTPLIFSEKKIGFKYEYKPNIRNFEEEKLEESISNRYRENPDELNSFRKLFKFNSKEDLENAVSAIQEWITDKKEFRITLGESSSYLNSDKNTSAELVCLENREVQKITILEKQDNDHEVHTEIIICNSDNFWVWVQIESNLNFVMLPPVFVRRINSFANEKYIDKTGKLLEVCDDRSFDNFISVFNSKDRLAPIFVMGSDADLSARNTINKNILEWVRALSGLALFFFLDEEYTKKFNETLTDNSLKVYPWTLRAYRGGVLYNDESDYVKPRLVGKKRLLNQGISKHNKFLIVRIARTLSNDDAYPQELIDANNLITKQRNRDLLFGTSNLIDKKISQKAYSGNESIESVGGDRKFAPGQVATLGALEFVFSSLGLSVNSDNVLTLGSVYEKWSDFEAKKNKIELLLNEQQAEIDRLRTDNQEGKLYIQLCEDDREALTKELQKSQRQVSFLQQELINTDKRESAYAFVDENIVLEDFDDLLSRLKSNDLKYLKFTGEVKKLQELDEIDTQSKAVNKIWTILCSLNDYGRYKAETGNSSNIYQYLDEAPNGYITVPKSIYSARESDTTMRMYRADRIFKVDRSERYPDGTAEMFAHFKVGVSAFGLQAPRIHILDDTNEGNLIYIGYIGPHLRVASTN